MKQNKAVRDHEAARDRDEWLREIAKATSLMDYTDCDIVDRLDTYTWEVVYTYDLPDGVLTICAQRCYQDYFAEIEEATLAVGDEEYDFKPYVQYMK